MKKVLFASTALVAFAGAAAADVALTGSAEMGIFGSDDVDTQFHTDIDVTFTMSGETDGGLTFGATIDLDESDGSNVGENNVSPTIIGAGPDGIEGTTDDEIQFAVPGSAGASPAFVQDRQGGETIFLSGNFGTLTAGDTDGALDWAVTEVAFNSGSLNDDETEHAGYNGNSGHDGAGGGDGQILRYDYSFGDFGVALSAEQIPGTGADGGDDTILGLGVKYGFDFGGGSMNFGLGYQDSDVAEVVAASLSGTFGAVSAGISAMSFDLDDDTLGGDFDHIGVGVGYSAGAISVSANYGQYDFDNGDDAEGFGLSAGYDLGGGAAVQFGYGYSDTDIGGVNSDSDTYSLGVSMSF